MAYEPGEIYFVRETAKELELGRTPFVKVGLVKEKDGRDSFGRLAEHQTGNPRTLFINKEDIVKTDAVTRIEALLHRIYANKRINGEWFLLETEEEIQEVISKAKELSEEIKPYISKFDEAEKLKSKLSNGKTKPASEADLANALKLATAKYKISLIEEAKNEVTSILIVIKEAGGDVSDVVRTIVKTFKPKFDEKAFKEALPDMWKKYSVTEKTLVSPRFLPKAKFEFTEESLDETFQLGLEKARNYLIEAKKSHNAILLNDASLLLTNLEGLAEWDLDLATAELKISIGEFDGIEDLVMWKRVEAEKTTLNVGLLAAEQDKTYKEYLVTPDPKEYELKKRKKA